MTGMGRDGVEGCKRIIGDGGATFGQDEATSAVHGMNKAVQRKLALDKLPGIINKKSNANV